jgi:hypothetical protein
MEPFWNYRIDRAPFRQVPNTQAELLGLMIFSRAAVSS